MNRRTTSLAAAGTVVLVPVVAVTVLAVAGDLAPAPAGLPDPGALTRWGLPATRALHDAAAVITIGMLVLTTVVLPRDPPDPERFSAPQAKAMRIAAITGTVWAVLGVVMLVLTYCEVSGVSLLDPGLGPQLGAFVVQFELGRLLLGSTIVIAVVATGAHLATQLSAAVLLQMLAFGALLMVALTGHTSGADNHSTAVNTQLAHMIGVTAWVGGLAGLGLLRGTLGTRFPGAARRFSTVAAACFVLVAVSGVAGAVARTEGWPDLTSRYGQLLVAKVALLAVLGAAGWLHRRRTLARLDAGQASGRAFGRLAAGELAVMAVAIGLGVALSRTPLP